jgi:hypothetical protein
MLHDQEHRTVVLADVVDRADVRMIQAGDDPLAVALVLAVVGGTVAGTAPRAGEAQVIHSVSGSGDVTDVWRGSYLFSAVKRADGTVSGQVLYVDTELGGSITSAQVTHMNIVGNAATVFADLPEGFECDICGPDVHPTHFFFVVVQGTDGKPDQVGWPLYFADWPGYTVEDLFAMTPKEFIEWEASWGFFDPPLLTLEGHIVVR